MQAFPFPHSPRSDGAVRWGSLVDGGETLKARLPCKTEKGSLVFLLKERVGGGLFPISSTPQPGLLFPSSLQGPESLLM